MVSFIVQTRTSFLCNMIRKLFNLRHLSSTHYNVQVFEDNWTGPPIIGQSYFYEMDDYRKTTVLVNVIQLDRINHSVLIRLPNGGERDSEYSKLLGRLVPPPSTAY
jgi:hypothetical protein